MGKGVLFQQSKINTVDIAKIVVSVLKINEEMGQVRDRLTSIEVNLQWVKWFVLTSAGALIVGLINLILFVKNNM